MDFTRRHPLSKTSGTAPHISTSHARNSSGNGKTCSATVVPPRTLHTPTSQSDHPRAVNEPLGTCLYRSERVAPVGKDGGPRGHGVQGA